VDYSQLSAEELAVKCFEGGDESAWAEFIRRFHPLIAKVVIRVASQWGDPSPHTVDDLVQDTYLKLCADGQRFLQRFKAAHRDALFGYIKVFTANLAHDHFRARRSRKRDSEITDCIDSSEIESQERPGIAPVSGSMDRVLLIRQVESCLQRMAPDPEGRRDRRIFWLYYRVGMSASEIAALPTIELSTKGVESTLLRLTRQLRERLVNTQQRVPLTRAPREKGDRTLESL
jgi:RNA polymerase sigma-70 factor (ECF subfamily)